MKRMYAKLRHDEIQHLSAVACVRAERYSGGDGGSGSDDDDDGIIQRKITINGHVSCENSIHLQIHKLNDNEVAHGRRGQRMNILICQSFDAFLCTQSALVSMRCICETGALLLEDRFCSSRNRRTRSDRGREGESKEPAFHYSFTEYSCDLPFGRDSFDCVVPFVII